MKKTIVFHSVWAEQMQQFVAFKRMQGYDYSSQARKLCYFDRFVLNETVENTDAGLSLDLLRRYVETTAHHQNGFSRQSQLGSLREFSRYLHARLPQSTVLPVNIVPSYARKVRFYRIEPHQIAELMAAAQHLRPAGGIRAPSLSTLIGLLFSTGLRINEALELTLADIDPQRSILHVVHGKFGKQRLVPISPSTGSALKRYMDIRFDTPATATLTGKGNKTRVVPLREETLAALTHYLELREQSGIQSEHLILSNKAQPMTRFGIWRRIEKLAAEAAQHCPTLQGRHITPHTFRHTLALHLLESGADIVLVQEWLGHADLRTTSQYLEVSIERKRTALEKVPPPEESTSVKTAQWKQPVLMAFLTKLSQGVMLRPSRSTSQNTRKTMSCAT